MQNNLSHTNTSFDFLKESSEFLNLIIHNIPSCVIFLDKDMMLHAYNNALKTIFSNREDEHILYHKCGNVIGCAYAVEEEKECGTTTMCQFCSLRESALMSYTDNRNIFKQRLDREFYKKDFTKEMKHLQFSSRVFSFRGERYIVLIIDDITHLIKLKESAQSQQKNIDDYLNR